MYVSSSGSIPKEIEWIKGSNSADISIHIDYGVMEIIPDKSKDKLCLVI
jgi:hypothetical protein